MPKAASIRRGRNTDLTAILRLEAICFSAAAERFNRRQVQRLLNSPTSSVLVAVNADRQIVAWAAGLSRQHSSSVSGRVYAVGVDPAARGQQLGQRLIQSLLRSWRKAGVKNIYLEVRRNNKAAISLYEKLGFQCVGELPDYYGKGRHGLKFQLVMRP